MKTRFWIILTFVCSFLWALTPCKAQTSSVVSVNSWASGHCGDYTFTVSDPPYIDWWGFEFQYSPSGAKAWSPTINWMGTGLGTYHHDIVCDIVVVDWHLGSVSSGTPFYLEAWCGSGPNYSWHCVSVPAPPHHTKWSVIVFERHPTYVAAYAAVHSSRTSPPMPKTLSSVSAYLPPVW